MSDYSPQAAVKIDGTDLSDKQQAQLEREVVDLHLHLPDMFALTFDDSDEDHPILDDLGVAIGSTVEVSAMPSNGGAPEKLITGEVTALEGDYGHWGRRVIVRGYDMTHRLHRGRVTETYQNVTHLRRCPAGRQPSRASDRPDRHHQRDPRPGLPGKHLRLGLSEGPLP
jgi:hypothetical protein